MSINAQDVPQALGDLFTQILQLNGEASPDDYQSLITAGAVKILELKSVHRGMCESTETLREATSDAKVHLDQSSLQLQSLIYEKHHYEKEIQSCTSFRSAYPDAQLELIPLEEYISLSHADDRMADGDEVPAATENPHQQMLDRLQHELVSREETVKQLEALKAKRDALAAEVAQRRSALANLDGDVAKLRTSAHRMQNTHSIESAVFSEKERLAAVLPAPLYLLFTHLRAAAAVQNLPLQVSVVGKQANTLRKEMHQAMLRSPSTPANVVDATLARAAEQACQTSGGAAAPFPLAVAVAVNNKQPGETPLTATFHYIPSLHLVTVVGENAGQDAVLCMLCGAEEGNAAEAPQVAAAGIDSSALPGKAYAWAQRAAGIDLLPPLDALVSRGGGGGGAEGLGALQQYQYDSRAAAVAQKLVQAAMGKA